MTASLILIAGLALAAEPEKHTLPVQMLSLSTDPAHVRIEGKRLYISGFHSGKLSALNVNGKKREKELPLDSYESYRIGQAGQEIREVRKAAGGDLVLANGKIFVGQVFQGSLLVADRATFTPVKRLPLGGEGCLAATRDGKTVFFASNSKSEFHIIGTKTYEYRTIAYPEGGRGIGCIALAPDEKRLYLGIQRGGKLRDGKQLSGGNCFLAVYDLAAQKYAGTVFLAQQLPDGSGDDGMPTSLAFSPDGQRLYAGMFQSMAGVQVVDLKKLELLGNIYFASKHQKPGLPWTDPLSVAVFGRWLLVAVRSNQELAAVDLTTHKIVARISHGEPVGIENVAVAGNQICVFGGSSTMTILDGADLSKLLVGVQLEKTGPAQGVLAKK